ncbi:MAG: phospho-N-acetylmuramoyl-pentapeptide-transferase [Bacteroidetes bacterium]|jgi:phospho-N-acetylmuramoyl-pentapeptide-transferase|nr:phospho-N-acetylmuramoyl-pentapeptide-transferase [Bacteroidota bacterium]
MLYYLATYLRERFNLPGFGILEYVTVRAIIAIIVSLVISVWFGNFFIDYMKRRNISETQRDPKVDPFNVNKKGVPTMGGLIIISSILVPCLLFGKIGNIYMILMLVTTLILGGIGFADDYIKTFKKNKDGLKGWYKIFGQVLLGLIVGLTLRFSPQVVMNETVSVKIEDNKEVVIKSPDVKSTRTTIPFFKNHNLNYADIFNFMGEPYKYWAGWVFFVLLTVFVVAAVSNGSNLNDGMDGMAAGNSAIIGLGIGILAYLSSNAVLSGYLDIMYIPGSEEVAVFLAAFVGSLVGFLWFNSYPAQVFMGDTGSLTIGGIIAVSAIIIHKELLLPIMCGIFLVESFSVIIQRAYFRAGKKKGVHQRVWKRTPIHDHYRTSMDQVLSLDPGSTVIHKGPKNLYHEVKITIRFWIITIILVAIAILTLKIR